MKQDNSTMPYVYRLTLIATLGGLLFGFMLSFVWQLWFLSGDWYLKRKVKLLNRLKNCGREHLSDSSIMNPFFLVN